MYVSKIKRFIEANNISQADVARKLGYSVPHINRIVNGSLPFNVKFEATFMNAFPDYANFENENKISEYEPIGSMVNEGQSKYIPAFKGHAFATISPAMADVVTLQPDTFVRIPMFSQGEYAVQVTGHSMKPYISHGDWAVIKRITNRDAVIYGEPYLVITKSDNLKTVKFLKAGDEPDTFWLVPYNVEQFEPQEIDKEEVLELYRVVGLFRTV